MSEYGLPTPRNGDGSLQAVDHSYEWEGQEITIKLIPPTLGQMERYEDLGSDVATEKLKEVIDRHIEEPDEPAEDMTIREVNCYSTGIMDYGAGGSSRIQAAAEELEKRQNASGN